MYFIIDLLLIFIIYIRWFICLIMPKTWIFHKEFEVAYHILQAYYNFLPGYLSYTSFIFKLMFDLFVIWYILYYF